MVPWKAPVLGGCFALVKHHKNPLLSPGAGIRSMSSCPQPPSGLPEVVSSPLPWEFIPSKAMSQLGWSICWFTFCLPHIGSCIPFLFHLPLTSCSSNTFIQLLHSGSNLRLIKKGEKKERSTLSLNEVPIPLLSNALS